jgi:hypothetical protein
MLKNKLLKNKCISGRRLPLRKQSYSQSKISKRLQEWELLKILKEKKRKEGLEGTYLPIPKEYFL